MKVFFDGGCRPAPVGMEVAVVIGGRLHLRRALGAGTSMDAEWLALLEAVRLARDLADPVLLGDAAAVIAQASGAARCPPAYAGYREQFRLSSGGVRLRYVRRAQNLAGIALAALHGR